MDPLLPSFRRQLRARAHSLHPVVSIGQHGLTDSVLREIDVALTAHELIKVRVFDDDRRRRESMLGRITHALDCAPVQQIGKLLVLWRPRPASPSEDASGPRDHGRPSPGAARRRRRIGAQVATSPGSRRTTSSGRVRKTTTATGKTRATPVGKTRARTPEPGSSLEVRKPRKAGLAPAGVPRSAARRRRREP